LDAKKSLIASERNADARAQRRVEIATALALLGALDSDAFAVYFAQVLAPALHPGQIVICDIRSIHKCA
jgi:hypothetical protein